jgi:zinc transport system ATP-binding protein
MPLLTVDAVVAGYRDPVVGPISFTVSDGEVVGLAGPNGSGKTTLLGAVIGTSRVFSGRVTRPPGLRIAVQSQRPAKLPEMPVTGRELLHVTGADRHAVPDVIAPLLPLRIDRLSGGQYQLLHVWACLASPATLVLLDEPTNNMDPQAVVILQELMAAGREHGRGVIVVSHDHAFLEAAGSTIVEVVP